MGIEHTPLLPHCSKAEKCQFQSCVQKFVLCCKAPIQSVTLFNKYLKLAENAILGIFTKTFSLQRNNTSIFITRHINAFVQDKLEFLTNSIVNNKPQCFKTLNDFLTESVNELEEVVFIGIIKI
jgi:hypothetical protein